VQRRELAMGQLVAAGLPQAPTVSGGDAPQRAGLDRAAALRLAGEYGGHPDDARKDDPFDVAVWQASAGDEPAWESPWGPGRPGWHAECAAMALHAFGPAVDVLAGGARRTGGSPSTQDAAGRIIPGRVYPCRRTRSAASCWLRGRRTDG